MQYVRTPATRVRQHHVLSSHAASTRVSGTTLCSAAENHTKGESSIRDPLVLVLRGWSVLGVTRINDRETFTGLAFPMMWASTSRMG